MKKQSILCATLPALPRPVPMVWDEDVADAFALALKKKALARTAPQHAEPGRYQPSDTVLAYLDGL